MGGYSNWSAAENAAYAGKTGTTNIGAGSGWLAASAQLGSEATDSRIAAELGRAAEYNRFQQSQPQAQSTIIPRQVISPTIYQQKGETPWANLNPVSSGTNQPNYPGFVFGNEGQPYRKEGEYRAVGDFTATMPRSRADEVGVSHAGTLYKSDLGAWELVDAKHQLIMSGSAGSPLPELSAYPTKAVPGTKPQTAGTQVQPVQAASELQPDREVFLTATPNIINQAPSQPSGGNQVTRSISLASDLFTPPKQTEVVTLKSKPTYSDNLFGLNWGTSKSDPYLSRGNTTSPEMVVKKVGEYDVYGDGSIRLRSTGQTIQNLTNQSQAPKKSVDYLGGLLDSLSAHRPHLVGHEVGQFGGKHDKKKPKSKPSVRKQKQSNGFIGMINEMNDKLDKKTKNTSYDYSILSAISTKPKKSAQPKPEPKKKVTKPKEPSYGSAWSDILYRSTKKPKRG